MSFNGSGTFVINSTGEPVVTGTVISSSNFNSLTADLGTGLSTTVTKDGQTTTTAKIPFAQGLSAAAASNFAAGTVGLPAIYLSTDTTTGLYRIGANNDGFAVSGAKVLDIASTGLGVTGTLSATGVSSFAAGTVGAPSIYLGADTTTGLYRISANNDGFAVSGAKVLDIASTGLAVTGTLNASGATTLSTTLGVTGAATLSSTLGVTGTSTLRTTSLRDTTPEANNTYTLGTNALRWGDLRTQVGQCYGLLDVGTADVNIGYSKMLSILAPATTAGVLIQVQGSAYPCVANWSYDNTGDNTFQYFYANSAGDLKGNISFNRAAGLTAYSTTSDGTLKNIIGDAPQAKSLSILSNTRLREYSWKDDANNKPQIGVIAQELVNVFSGAVSVGGDVETTDAEGNVTTKYRPWTVDRTAYQFHLVAGWQNHESKIAALEARLAALEAK